MRYTTLTETEHTHLTRVSPLNPEIIRVAFTVRIPDFKTIHTESSLSLYAALAQAGTTKKTKQAFTTYLRKHGISLEVSAGKGIISFTLSVRKVNIPYAVTLLNEIIFSPALFLDEIKAKKMLLLEDNRESRDDAKLIARIAFHNMLYPVSSFLHEQTLDASLAEIKGLSEKSLTKLHTAIQKGEWYITLVSDREGEEMFAPLITALNAHGGKVPRPVSNATAGKSNHTFVTVPGKTNVEVRIGNVIPITPLHTDYEALRFGIDVLGKVGGFSGRLMSTVREKEGLTYGIYATTVELNPESTIHWNIYTFFAAKDLKKGLAATRREIERIIAKGITHKELTTFKDIIKNQYLISHESNMRRLSTYHALSVRGYSETTLIERMTRLQTLTLREINAALRTYIDSEKLIMSGAGPVSKEGEGTA